MKIIHIPSVWEQKKEQLKRDRQTRQRLVNDGYRIEFLIQLRGGEKPEIVEQRERERKLKPFGKLLERDPERDCCTMGRMEKRMIKSLMERTTPLELGKKVGERI